MQDSTNRKLSRGSCTDADLLSQMAPAAYHKECGEKYFLAQTLYIDTTFPFPYPKVKLKPQHSVHENVLQLIQFKM